MPHQSWNIAACLIIFSSLIVGIESPPRREVQEGCFGVAIVAALGRSLRGSYPTSTQRRAQTSRSGPDRPRRRRDRS
jgi:hypothetical protein